MLGSRALLASVQLLMIITQSISLKSTTRQKEKKLATGRSLVLVMHKLGMNMVNLTMPIQNIS